MGDVRLRARRDSGRQTNGMVFTLLVCCSSTNRSLRMGAAEQAAKSEYETARGRRIIGDPQDFNASGKTIGAGKTPLA
jgi:hypothetical protein